MSSELSNAVAHFQAGRWHEAVEVSRQLTITEPLNPDVWQLLGLSNCQLGRFEEAVVALEEAIRLRPDNVALANNLGEVLRQAGRLEESERCLRSALLLRPHFAEACFNLGNTLRDQGRGSEAIALYQQALAIRPDYAKAHLNLANLLRSEGRLPRAVEHYRLLLTLQPPSVDVLLAYADVCTDLHEYRMASELVRRVSLLEPENDVVLRAQANQARLGGEEAEARRIYRKLAERDPASLPLQLRAATILPEIPLSVGEIEANRFRLLEELESLRDRNLEVDLATLHTFGAEPPMAWAYHGLDVKPLRLAYSQLFTGKLSPLGLRPMTGKPRLGVVVTNGHEGVYAECLGRMVARLPNDELDVTVICSRAGGNILRHLLEESAEAVDYLSIPDRIDLAAARIRDANFDLLHYWEIGTDSQNYFLPFLKPAPVQSTCWGWPVTSGISQVDYFVSSELIELSDADADYTEKLIRLKTLPTWYAKPPVPPRFRSREDCGLPADGNIYLCTQNLKKYHPDFDKAVGEILRRDPHGRVAVISDSHPAISERLRDRFRVNLPDVANRVLLLPRLPRADYLHFVGNANVILDTLHYGGGANSLYDAFACGIPVVSLPGRFHRSRYAAGAYAKLGISELIATSVADYVEKALRVGGDSELRESISERILERADVLFFDDEAVTQHRTFFLDAIYKARQ